MPGVKIQEKLPLGENSYQMNPKKISAEKRDAVLLYLNERGVGASANFDPPAHWQTAYARPGFDLPVTEKLARSTITLPISAVQTVEQTQYVLDILRKALQS